MKRTETELREIRQLMALAVLLVDKDKLKTTDAAKFPRGRLADIVGEMQKALAGETKAIRLHDLAAELGIEWIKGSMADALFAAVEKDGELDQFERRDPLAARVGRYIEMIQRKASNG